MTLSIKPGYEEKIGSIDKNITISLILIACVGITAAIVISGIFGSSFMSSSSFISSPPYTVKSIPATDLGSVKGHVIESDRLPINGALVQIYKHMPLMDSAERKAGFTSSVRTGSVVSY
jgi:hypothetical protein